MKICFVPIDNRPVCYNLAKDICAIDEDIELFIPPKEMLGGLTEYADTEGLYNWLKGLPEVDCMILSLDTLAYGGLIPSRRITDSLDEIRTRMERIKPILRGKKVLAFSSIMRISNNNCNEEEKEYWKDWGKKIFEFSYNSCKYKKPQETDIPREILMDYMETRKRNFTINAMYYDWQREGIFNTLVFSKDDCAQFGFNVSEAVMLENWGAITKTGADEIPLTLLARALEKDIIIYPKFIEPEYTDRVSNYEDISIEHSVISQLWLGGFKLANVESDADVVLVINNFKEKQGELVMGWDTEPYKWGFSVPSKPFAVADVRFANGSDNALVETLFSKELPQYGYAGWNTSANTLGSLLAGVKVKWNASKYNDKAFKKLQVIRYLDDWAYQANIRGQIESPCDIKNRMIPYENRVLNKLFDETERFAMEIQYTYPWNRKFEIEVHIAE
ncbi:DUF4127 family protein [bacterium]|nr:DUF4127 family protein [bacterium]